MHASYCLTDCAMHQTSCQCIHADRCQSNCRGQVLVGTGNRYRQRKVQGEMDAYGCTAFRKALITFAGVDTNPNAAECLNTVTNAQIANLESLVGGRLCQSQICFSWARFWRLHQKFKAYPVCISGAQNPSGSNMHASRRPPIN